jgi:hypothetical protein
VASLDDRTKADTEVHDVDVGQLDVIGGEYPLNL